MADQDAGGAATDDDKSPPDDDAGSVEIDVELAARRGAASAPASAGLLVPAAGRGDAHRDGNGDDGDGEDGGNDGETAPSASAVAMGMAAARAENDESAQPQPQPQPQAEADDAEAQAEAQAQAEGTSGASTGASAHASSSNTSRTSIASGSSSRRTGVGHAPSGPRFPRGGAPGAYHVVPRTRASLTGAPTGRNGNSSSSVVGLHSGGNAVHVETDGVRTDEVEVLAATILLSTVETQRNGSNADPASAASADRDIVLPVPNGFVRQQRTTSQRQSEANATGSGRNSSSRRSSFASSVPGAHPVAGINSSGSGSNSGGTGGGDGGIGSRQSSLASTNTTAAARAGSASGLGSALSSSAGVGDAESGGEAWVDVAVDPEVTATAYLVEDQQELEDLPSAEIVDLDEIRPPPQPFHRRREGRVTLLVIGLLLLALAILLGVLLTNDSSTSEGSLADNVFTEMPTQAPTYDPRPTLEAVQSRGVVRCGIEEAAGGAVRFGQYTTNMCQGLAAAVLGDPSRVRLMPVGDNDRYRRLLDREVDVLFAGDTFTLEKLVREASTESGLAFGYPYYQAAVVYAGLPTYVQCANNQKRHDECDDLSICAVETPEIRSLITSYFPTSFVTFGLFPAMEASLRSGACNVIVSDTYRLSGSSLQEDIDSGRYIISDYYISRNLISSVVRLGDPVWYDVVEGMRVTAFRASQIGLYQDLGRCPANATTSGTDAAGVAGVSFYNATFCVGNAVEVFQRSLGQTVLSYGTYLPIIDAPNFGSLECDDCANVLESKGGLQEISDRGHLNCAVYLNPMYNLTLSSLATLVNVKFCELMAVAIFQGKADAVNITYIDEMDYSAFPQEFDVVAGAGFESKVGWDVTNAGSMSFGWPYFVHDKYQYGGSVYDGVGLFISYAIDNENVSLIFVATAVVTATVYAQRQGITRESSFDMPLIHTFGDGLTFMLRDVVSFGGNYDDILSEALSSSDGTAVRGWNDVIPNSFVAAKTPVSYCDYTGNCPPCEWLLFDGTYICISVGPY